MSTYAPTPGQTVGPFFGFALPSPEGPLVVPAGHPDAVQLHGRVLDGAGAPVPDALLEVWQDGPDGQDEAFRGFGRAPTDDDGHYAFTTLTPAAPFFSLVVFARGLGDRLFTRAYLPEHPGTGSDALLAGLDPERRATLMASRDDDGWRFDVRLQGEAETVFLRYPRH